LTKNEKKSKFRKTRTGDHHVKATKPGSQSSVCLSFVDAKGKQNKENKTKENNVMKVKGGFLGRWNVSGRRSRRMGENKE
jgi:hypothetical protein